MNLTAWAWLIVPLAVCRVTQVILHDDILRRPRMRIVKRSNKRRDDKRARRPEAYWRKHPELAPYAYKAKLLECPWCVSIWVSLPIVLGLVLWRTVTIWACLVPALSLIAVIIDHALDRWLPDEPSKPPTPPEPGPEPTELPSPEVAALLSDALEA